MANRRKLKQDINIVCGELFAECIAASLYSSDVNDILTAILVFHDDFIRRVSHTEPGMTPKTYFNKLKADFNKEATEVVDQIVALG